MAETTHRLRHLLRGMEVPLCLYMCSSFMKYSIFQSLLYEKACLSRYGLEAHCSNVSLIHGDKQLQIDANHLYLVSSLTLLIPSLFVALFLGSLSDAWNAKIPMLIPLVGLIAGDMNYILQCVNPEWNPYFLMLSDLAFGLCGGYTAIIGTMLAYNMKTSMNEQRSVRVAFFEGSIGLGATIGYAVSGSLREAVGYTWAFCVLMSMHVAAYLYVLIFAQDNQPPATGDQDEPPNLGRTLCSRLVAVYDFVVSCRRQTYFGHFCIILTSLAVELFIFSGVSDVQYSFLRYRLGWNDEPYGWYQGIASFLSTLAIFFLYPLLHHRGFTDLKLAIGGFIFRIIFLVMFAFIFANWYTYLTAIPQIPARFGATGLRAVCSHLVADVDHGKLFALTSLIEGVTSILATFAFNGLYPLTLDFFAGGIFIAVAMCLAVPLVLLINIQ